MTEVNGSKLNPLAADMVRGRVRQLELENDTLKLIVKHCLLERQRQFTMRVSDFEAADQEPNLLLVEDEVNDRLIIKFEGEVDLVIV